MAGKVKHDKFTHSCEFYLLCFVITDIHCLIFFGVCIVLFLTFPLFCEWQIVAIHPVKFALPFQLDESKFDCRVNRMIHSSLYINTSCLPIFKQVTE